MSKNILFYRLAVITLFFLQASFIDAFPDPAHKNGIISGKVVNEDGQVLAGADVFIANLQRGASTDGSGKYEITNLREGNYSVSVKYIGCQSKTKPVKIKAGQTVSVDFVLAKSLLETEPIVVTGSPIAADPLKTPQDISCIGGRQKLRMQAASLGKTIESIPGVYNLSAGSAAGKPVIHGHTGERIRILSDGISQEYQQYGERHAPTIDPFNYERVEVIKGAASLLYGSDAIGGVVNLISPQFKFGSYKSPSLIGDFTSQYNTNNSEFMGGVRLSGAAGGLAFRGSFAVRNAGNFHTPEKPTYIETQKSGDPKFTGEIDHTDFQQLTGSFGAGYLTDLGLFSAAYDHFLNENNFLLPTGYPIGLRIENQIITLRGLIPGGKMIFKPQFSYQFNHRQASKPGLSRDYIPDSAAVDLKLNVYTCRLDIEHSELRLLSGTFGAEVKYYDHENIGLVPLQPTGYFTNYALFAFEEIKLNKLTVDAGVRFDYRKQKFLGCDTNPLLPKDDRRSYNSISGAFGASYSLTDNLTAAANIGRGFRTPSFYNLYVYGYHGGVFAFQIGNPELGNETSLDLNGSLRYKTAKVQAFISGYYNTINNYIFLYNAPGHPLAPVNETFVFSHDQEDARITGIDIGLKMQILSRLVIGGDFSTIESKFLKGPSKDYELPLMPANRFNVELKYFAPNCAFIINPYAGLKITGTSAKDAAGIYEPFGQFDDGIGPDIPFGTASTKAYTLLNALLGFDLDIGKQEIKVDIEFRNLLDEAYRDFLDTYKGYALGPGRSVSIKVNFPFSVN